MQKKINKNHLPGTMHIQSEFDAEMHQWQKERQADHLSLNSVKLFAVYNNNVHYMGWKRFLQLARLKTKILF